MNCPNCNVHVPNPSGIHRQVLLTICNGCKTMIALDNNKLRKLTQTEKQFGYIMGVIC